MLVDLDHSSTAVKRDVALVVGHELAHQWFGNLVSSLSLLIALNIACTLYIEVERSFINC